MRRSICSLLICMLALLCSATTSMAQEVVPDETLRVQHRVVFMDAVVKDKRTGLPISDLKEQSFEVFADGKPRAISYFGREGDGKRRPLAIVLVLDLRRFGAGRFLRRTEVLEAMATELAKLPPEDEVAVMALDVGGHGGKTEWLSGFTHNRAQVISALAAVPMMVAAGASDAPETGEQDAPQAENKDAGQPKEEAKVQAEPDENDETVTKTVNKDGSVTTKRVNKDGNVEITTVSKDGTKTVNVEGGFELSQTTFEVVRLVTSQRLNSQAAMVWVTDGITPILNNDRDVVETHLIRANVIFSALVTDMKMGYKLFMPVLKPLGNWAGISIYGSAQRLAKQSGGEVVRVRRPQDYSNGLSKIFGSLTSRYSLGFTLAEQEQDDGRMHELEVRVKARDAKGKERKLEVISRRGYFMPKEQKAAK